MTLRGVLFSSMDDLPNAEPYWKYGLLCLFSLPHKKFVTSRCNNIGKNIELNKDKKANLNPLSEKKE